MYETIKEFYKSNAWRKVRDDYWRRRKGLCERCLRKGLLVPGEEVHHIKRLTKANINNPAITLNPDNLELLCKDCHHAEHKGDRRQMFGKYDKERRYIVMKDGRIISR